MSVSVRELYDVYNSSGLVAAALCCNDLDLSSARVDDWLFLVSDLPEILPHMNLSWCPIEGIVHSVQEDPSLLDRMGDICDASRMPDWFDIAMVQINQNEIKRFDITKWTQPMWQHLIHSYPHFTKSITKRS